MKITEPQKKEIEQFIKTNPELFDEWNVEDHNQESLVTAMVLFELFLKFCENIHKIDAGVTTIGKVLSYAKKLLGFSKKPEALSGRERVLMVIFDNYAKLKKGMDEQKIQNVSGIPQEDLTIILKDLEEKQIVRKTVTGNWIYKN